jgi:rubrerythrin
MSDEKYVEALKWSVDMEKKGCRFYEQVAAKTNNELGKKVFLAMAKDETLHLEAIIKFNQKLLREAELPDMEELITREHKKGDESIFKKIPGQLENKAGVDADDLKAYNIAMQMEKDGYEYYKECLDEATDDMVKKLFRFLIEEESTHYQLLMDTYLYLAHPADWFAGQERPIFEGG